MGLPNPIFISVTYSFMLPTFKLNQIHLFFCCSHGKEHKVTHNVVKDVLLSLLEMLGFMFCMNRYTSFHRPPSNFLHQWVDFIMLSTNEVCTLVDVVIANMIQMNLVSQVATSQLWPKQRTCYIIIDKLLFFFLFNAIKIFGCSHQQVTILFIDLLSLHDKSTKVSTCCPLLILC